ncbi:hypothetical protein ACFSTD_21835 [Novosphingobium colocasiae]
MRAYLPFMRSFFIKLAIGIAVLIVAVAGYVAYSQYAATSKLPLSDTEGRDPKLGKADPQTIPGVRLVETQGWADGEAPIAAKGLAVSRFAEKARSSAHHADAAERRCAGGRNQCAGQIGDGRVHRDGRRLDDEESWRRSAFAEQDRITARRRWRRQGREALRFPHRRHGFAIRYGVR